MSDITELTKLIDLDLLEALYDEWMDAEYFNVSLSGTSITVTDKRGNTNTTDLAAASKQAKAEWDNTYKPQMDSDHTRAENDHTASVTATTEASRVNAQISGLTVTITNRSGVSKSVDIGFEMFRTYTSVSAMNADAANVPQGKFVIIATEDATSTDNAKLYCKNSQGTFTFLSDLDQASSAAWADWLDNMKPQIEAATALANEKAALANTKAQLADEKATLANTNATFAQTQGNRAKGYNDHPWTIGNDGYIYVWNETTQQMTKTNKVIIDFDDLTTAQRQAMAQAFYDTLVIASTQTCEAIVDELT